MVLVLNSPPILWMIISWLIHIFHKSTTKQFLATTWQTITQALWLGDICHKCISEYSCFIVFTIICTLIKIALQCAWLPITGLLWWYRFLKNIIDDPSGRSIMDIFRTPYKGYPQQHINKERMRHSEVHRFYRKSTSEPWKWRGQRKKRFIPPLFPLPDSRKRHPRPFRKRFPGTSRSTPMPSCFIPINHKDNKKR